MVQHVKLPRKKRLAQRSGLSEHEKLSVQLKIMVTPTMKQEIDAAVLNSRKRTPSFGMGDFVREAIQRELVRRKPRKNGAK